MENAQSPIGIFDSGVGGLSVVKAVHKQLPHEDILYVADSAHNPYGEKSSGFVQQRSRAITRFLIENGAKAIVVACNTATAMAADMLRAEFSLPIIAMEPAIKPAAKLTRSDVIGVLATAGTLSSDRYADLRDAHGQQVKVLEKHCNHWVSLVEQGFFDSEVAAEQIAQDILPLINRGVDTLVLGCTHFPLLDQQIRAIAGDKVTIVDPAPAVAMQIDKRLSEAQLLASGGSGELSIFSSGDLKKQQKVVDQIMQQRDFSINRLDI